MRLKLVALVALLAVGAGAVAFVLLGMGAPAPSASTYLTAQVTREDVVDNVAATGSLSASASYNLSFGASPVMLDGSSTASDSSSAASSAGSAASWTVSSVHAAVGDRVTKGTLLARASTADLEAQIQTAARAESSARIQLAVAQSSVDDATTTDQLRQAKIARYGAQTQLAEAQQQLADLKAMRSWSTLVAPVDGVVTSVSIQSGAAAPSGTAIVVQAATLEVVGDVVESDVPLIAVGQAATVTIEALGVDVPGTVSAIAPSAASSNSGSSGGVVTFAVTVTLQSPPAATRAGMSAQVAITVAQATNALTVPTAALGGTAGAYEVRVLGAEGNVTTRPVSVGLVTSSRAEITSGLNEGETVITGTTTQRTSTGASVFGGGGLGGGGGQRIVVPGGNP